MQAIRTYQNVTKLQGRCFSLDVRASPASLPYTIPWQNENTTYFPCMSPARHFGCIPSGQGINFSWSLPSVAFYDHDFMILFQFLSATVAILQISRVLDSLGRSGPSEPARRWESSVNFNVDPWPLKSTAWLLHEYFRVQKHLHWIFYFWIDW